MRLSPNSWWLLAVYLLMLAVVVLPFIFFGEQFDLLTAELIQGGRRPDVFLLTAGLLTLDVFLPIPSSALSVSAGMLLGMPMAFAACFTGLSAGCVLGYCFGYFFRKLNFHRWHVDDEFRHLSQEFSRRGYLVLLFARGVPILAEMSVILAGFHRYPFGRFMVMTSLANLVVAGLYSFLGEQAGSATSYYLLVAVFLMIPLVTFGARLFWLDRNVVAAGADGQ